MKKALSLILALAMLLACNLPAFAAVNAEKCEFCGNGTVVWDPNWTMIPESHKEVSCEDHHIDAFKYTEYRTYICRDCEEVAYWQYRDVFECALDSHGKEYTNLRTVFP